MASAPVARSDCPVSVKEKMRKEREEATRLLEEEAKVRDLSVCNTRHYRLCRGVYLPVSYGPKAPGNINRH